MPIPRESGGSAPEKLPAHRPPLHARSTSAANAGATPLPLPACASLETRPLLGLAAPPARPPTPGLPPGTEATAARETPRLFHPGPHRAHLQGAPAPAFLGRGWPGPQRGGQGPRFEPQAGRRAGRKRQAGGAASGLGRALRPSPGSETPTPFFPPRLRPPPSTRLREPGSPPAGRTQNTRGRAARALRPELRRAGGEGRTWRPGQGGRAPRRSLGAAAPGRQAPVSDQTSPPGHLASPAA